MAVIPKGQEPANIKKRLDTLFAKLDSAYPERVICSLNTEHKKWGEAVTELYRTLGYPSKDSFLEAYGYRTEKKTAGRPAKDALEVIEELKRYYPASKAVTSVGQIEAEHPELKGRIKTLSNSAQKLFGKPIRDYLIEIGVLRERDFKAELVELTEQLKARYQDPNHLPKTVQAVKDQNSDLPVYLLVYAKEFDLSTKEYLIKNGILAPELTKKGKYSYPGMLRDEDATECLRVLKLRYEDEEKRPYKMEDLALYNSDIPVRRLHAYLRAKGVEKPAAYYIKNGILKGSPIDMQEFHLCEISYMHQPQFDVQNYCLTETSDYAAGDIVIIPVMEYYLFAKVERAFTCLGVDSPVKIKGLPTVFRKATDSEIETQKVELSDRDIWCIDYKADDRRMEQLSNLLKQHIREASYIALKTTLVQHAEALGPEDYYGRINYQYSDLNLHKQTLTMSVRVITGDDPDRMTVLEKLTAGDPLMMDDDCCVKTAQGTLIGQLPSEIADHLSAMLCAGYAKIISAEVDYLRPLSQMPKEKRFPALYAVLTVQFQMPPEKYNSIIVYHFEDWKDEAHEWIGYRTSLPDSILSKVRNEYKLKQMLEDHLVDVKQHYYMHEGRFISSLEWDSILESGLCHICDPEFFAVDDVWIP